MNIPKPRGLRIRPPYDRNQSKKVLEQEVLEYFNVEPQKDILDFCYGVINFNDYGLPVCADASLDCLYGKKKCYFE